MLSLPRITPAGAGKTEVCKTLLGSSTGSPPQVRGKPLRPRPDKHRPRITPAGAGKTSGCLAVFDIRRDHPRRCGENKFGKHIQVGATGSPPQVRGKLSENNGYCRITRITPAGAGKTTLLSEARRRTPDHPRRCGENFATATNSSDGAGSPPQVRGKPVHGYRVDRAVGITPAGAGKTDGVLGGA